MHISNQSVRDIVSKVPEVTAFFWIIKVLCTTVGETAADFLNVNLNIGLTGTSVIVGALLVVALLLQFRASKYIPSVYWMTVVFISVFGTLVTDNLSDNFGVPLEFSTVFFSLTLLGTFIWWYRSEGTLSIHSIYTRRREAFYWLAILSTFALGTAAGDLMAEGLGLGYVTTGLIVALVIGVTAVLWRMGLQPVLAFWIIYILTRPLGASLGDFLTQPAKYGGLGFGVAATSAIFGTAILVTIIFLSRTKSDVIQVATILTEEKLPRANSWRQVLVTLVVVAVVSVVGYEWQQSQLVTVPAVMSASTTMSTTSATAQSVAVSPLGDVSAFVKLTDAMSAAVATNDFETAQSNADDLEYEWDAAESKLKPKNHAAWTTIDDKIDTVLRQIRSTRPNQTTSAKALDELAQSLR